MCTLYSVSYDQKSISSYGNLYSLILAWLQVVVCADAVSTIKDISLKGNGISLKENKTVHFITS